jgi:hypothetical protein
MRLPKFAIGNMFFVTYSQQDAELYLGENKKDNCGNYTHIPAVGIIREIKITKKDIIYVVEERFKTNEKVLTRTIEQNENEVEKGFNSVHTLIEKLGIIFNGAFAELTREINKEKLTEILNGGKE